MKDPVGKFNEGDGKLIKVRKKWSTLLMPRLNFEKDKGGNGKVEARYFKWRKLERSLEILWEERINLPQQAEISVEETNFENWINE